MKFLFELCTVLFGSSKEKKDLYQRKLDHVRYQINKEYDVDLEELKKLEMKLVAKMERLKTVSA